jgi:hypothetical protein
MLHLPSPKRLVRALPVALLLALTASCSSVGRPVHFSSDPAGAHVYIDGRDSGFVTPVTLDLADETVRRVDFQLPGYDPATRTLYRGSSEELVYWSDSTVMYLTWRFPLWLNWEDFLFPKTTLTGERPSRVFVRLRRASGG